MRGSAPSPENVPTGRVQAFSQGIYSAYEDLVTEPATLAALESERGYLADVGLVQGRYHQIKRMFGKFNNEVLALHRCAVGSLSLDGKLQPGASRDLEAGELSRITDSRGQNPLHV